MEEMYMVDEVTETGLVEAEGTEEKGSGALGLAVIGGVAAAVGGLLWATKNWRRKRRIAKLKKEGYLVYAPDEVIEADCDCEDVD